jgi:hypothetical protein
MKSFLIALGVAAVLSLAGCAEDEHRHDQGYGGTYEGWDHSTGHGDWRGDNNPYQHNTSPYQGYPNYNGYPYHY